MNTNRFALNSLGIALALVIVASAFAETEGKTTQGEEFVTGGIGEGERSVMMNSLNRYSLWVQTAAKAGPFVSGASVKITDKSGNVVLDTQLDGPWLMTKLQPGAYKVAVTYSGKTVERSTDIQAGDHHEMVFYFDESVDLLPKGSTS